MTLLDRIEIHLIKHRISATRFGRRAVGDPRFVLDLRMGRRPRRRTLERLNAYLDRIERGSEGKGLTRTDRLSAGPRDCQSGEQPPATAEPRPFHRIEKALPFSRQ